MQPRIECNAQGAPSQQQRIETKEKLDATIKVKEQAQGAVYVFERTCKANQNGM